ncbi:MAG: hypothetical protein ACRYFS_12000 [Janthinobacterium lividum]
MTLTLTPKTEAMLLARAKSEGQDINQLADVLLAHVLQEEAPKHLVTPEARNDDMRATAKMLADAARESDPATIKVLLFPSTEEIRLLYVDETARPTLEEETIAPYYFGADKRSGTHYTSAVALIRPEEEGKLHLPAGWGTWEDAVSI